MNVLSYCVSLALSVLIAGFPAALAQGQALAGTPLAKPSVTSPLDEEPRDEFRKHVARMLFDGDYADLDAAYETLRSGTQFFSNGNPKLAVFYNALLWRTFDGNPVSDYAIAAVRLERTTSMRAWLKVNPQSDAARAAIAFIKYDEAWERRGNDVAIKVTQPQWQGFATSLNEAIETLGDVRQPDAETFTLAIDIATDAGLPRSQKDGIFERAVASYPAYPSIYASRTRALLPKWGGSTQDICDLAASIAASADSAAMLNYSEVAEAMIDKPADIRTVLASGCLRWPLIKSSFERRATERGLNNIDGNAYLAISALARDRDAAAHAVQYITAYDNRFWASTYEFNFFLDWPTNVRGPNDPVIRPADKPWAPATVPLH